MYLRYNNWDRWECDFDPLFPGSQDNVIIDGGVATLESSTLINSLYLISDSTLTISSDGGDLSVLGMIQSDGRLVVDGMLFSLDVTSVATLNSGALTGQGTVVGDVYNIMATVSPGKDGIGLLTIAGTYVQDPSAILAIEMAGANPPDYDALIVNGSAGFTGVLRIIPINGFLPQPGQVFTVLTASSLQLGTLNIVSSGTFSVSFPNGTVELTVLTSPLSPDLNLDGVVNLLDLAIQSGPEISRVGPVDMDGDAVVDLDDLLILVGNWGSGMQ